jgi:hypothetical protein
VVLADVTSPATLQHQPLVRLAGDDPSYTSIRLRTIRRLRPALTCALGMEDPALARELGLGDSNVGRCNCIL